MSLNTLDEQVQQRAGQWLLPPYDDEVRAAVRHMLDEGQVTELTDAFYKDLEFGTGGLRGIMGPGTNRMNRYTIGKATQGLANYLLKVYPGEKIKIAIAYDSRNNSKAFADVVAAVFSANDCKVYLFEQLRPTPQLSFAIRRLGCHSGVMLTASHNPKEYNGYKAYWRDGGQLVAPHDRNVIDEVNAITDLEQIKFEARPENMEYIGSEMDLEYLERIAALSLRPDEVRQQKDLNIVYSPIHGTGVTLVPAALKRWGFSNVHIVEAQAMPDGNFPTVVYPNPEEEEAMSMAVKEGQVRDADLILATDPDADRVGVAVRNSAGEFKLLNGNQIGSLLVHYVLEATKEAGKLISGDYVVKTIVTTKLIENIADDYGVPCHDVLTGFKYIGELMTANEGEARFLVGGEESYGFLVGDLVRDKDAVVSCTFIAEMAAWYKAQQMTLFDALDKLYLKYGCYKEKLISITKKGKAGAEEIKAIMERLRTNPPSQLGGVPVVLIKDYLLRQSYNPAIGDKQPIELPTSDVLQFMTTDGDVISARPSGTEPKIKFYCSVRQQLGSTDDPGLVSGELEDKVDRIMKDLL